MKPYSTPVIGAVVAIAFSAPIAALFMGTPADGLAWATVVLAGVAGWLVARMPLGPDRRRSVLLAALVFGVALSVGCGLLAGLWQIGSNLWPGHALGAPESPTGYLFLLLVVPAYVAIVAPAIAIPAGLLALAWAASVRAIVGHAAQA